MYKKYIKNLRQLVLKRMGESDCTMSEFSVMCDVSYRELQKLTSGQLFRMRIDILVNICENAGISYVDVFECWKDIEQSSFDKELENFQFTNGISFYSLKKK